MATFPKKCGHECEDVSDQSPSGHREFPGDRWALCSGGRCSSEDRLVTVLPERFTTAVRSGAPGITSGRLTTSPFAYLRLIYRLPLIAATTAVCLFARLLGLKNAARAGVRFMSYVCQR